MILKDKVVIVAGFGPGLGASLARRALAEGAKLVVAARTADKLEAAAAELEGDVLAVPTDVNDEDAVRNLLDKTLERYGRVDSVLVNAFQMPPMDPLTQVNHDKVKAAMNTNVFAPLTLAAVFADALAETKGNLVMISTMVIRHSQPEYAAYKLTKAGLHAAAGSLATELGPRGIRVNSVAPGWIWEDVNKMYFDWMAKERGVTPQDIYDEVAGKSDLKRIADPDEVANATLFLASDLASAITGLCLDVNCGEYHGG
jgi:NAD(P)-dependent dehydrogenase (short-subunit alcohol dehydrogenase family)